MSVAIVDYGSGNLHSAAKAFERAARDLEEAERRFFEAWSGDTLSPAPAMSSYVPPPVSSVPPSSPDVLGLFPQPEPRTRS